MKLILKEDPKEWRKATWLAALGLAILSSLLCWWRHVLPVNVWTVVVTVLAGVAIAAALKPRWFRGYYRFSQRLGFGISQFGGRVILGLLFFVAVTPLGILLRLFGQDNLRLKRQPEAKTYWSPAKKPSALDRLF